MKTEDVKFKSIRYAKLNPKSTYLFQIDVTNKPINDVLTLCNGLKETLKAKGITNVIIYPYTEKRVNGKIEIVEVMGE